jgi:hypothetical protein
MMCHSTLGRFVGIAFGCTMFASASAQSLIYRIPGSGPGFDDFGISVAGGQDVDGDGIPDFVVGALYFDPPSLNNAGAARVFSGATGSMLFEFTGTSNSEEFGNSVALIPDVNQDGKADILVGGWRDDANGLDSGTAILYSGSDGSILRSFHGSQPGDFLGYSVAPAGDVDADGTPDLIIGAVQWNPQDPPGPMGTGYAKVFSGATGSELFTFNGVSSGDFFGAAVARAGDVDHDGHQDVIVNARLDDTTFPDSGSVTVLSGATGSILYFIPGTDGDLFGEGVGPAGDFNGDSFDDFLVGASREDTHGTDAGAVFLYSGFDGSLLQTFYGTHTVGGTAVMGASVCAVGDQDGDGTTDFLFGGTNVGTHGTACGAGLVFSGATAQVIFELSGDSAGDGMGTAVAAAGDIDQDGKMDMIVGAPFDDHAPAGDEGTVFVFSGACKSPVSYCIAKTNSLGCVPAMSYSGSSSMSGPDDFRVLASNVLNQKAGLLFWGFNSAQAPYQGGYRCLGMGFVRTPVQSSGGGSGSTPDCSGTYSYLFTHSYLLSRGAVAGNTIYAQYFSRDPHHSDGTGLGLTDGLRFTVCP